MLLSCDVFLRIDHYNCVFIITVTNSSHSNWFNKSQSAQIRPDIRCQEVGMSQSERKLIGGIIYDVVLQSFSNISFYITNLQLCKRQVNEELTIPIPQTILSAVPDIQKFEFMKQSMLQPSEPMNSLPLINEVNVLKHYQSINEFSLIFRHQYSLSFLLSLLWS